MTTTQQRTALVIGATGGIGGEVASALVRHGWTVRALTRRVQPARNGVEWIEGDAMVAADVARAARGVGLIVHAANPPGYRNWSKLVLPMIDNTIAAAKAQGARILLPGTVYNFGLEAFPLVDETAPQAPTTRKGGIRVEMERRLKAALDPGRAGADRPGRRLLRAARRQQLVRPDGDQAGRAGEVGDRAGDPGRGPRLGLSAGPGRDHGSAAGPL